MPNENVHKTLTVFQGTVAKLIAVNFLSFFKFPYETVVKCCVKGYVEW